MRLRWRAAGLRFGCFAIALATAMPVAAGSSSTVGGVVGDACVGGSGGDGTFALNTPQTVSFWGGDWDLVKALAPPPGPQKLGKICMCLSSNDRVNTAYDFDLVVYAGDGRSGKPGRLMLRVPAHADVPHPTFTASGWDGPNFYGFDVSSYALKVRGPVFVGVHSHTEGTDIHSLNICSYPVPAVGPVSFYRAGDRPVWQRNVRVDSDSPMIGIKASFVPANPRPRRP